MVNLRCFSAVMIAILFGSGQAAGEGLGHGYAYWSAFKPGTMVSFRCLWTGSGTDRTEIRTFRLKSVDLDRVVLTWSETPVEDLKESAPGIESFIEFKAVELPRMKEDLFRGKMGFNMSLEYSDFESEPQYGVEDLEVGGIRIRTDRVRHVQESSSARTTTTFWASEEIPGTLVKAVREIQADSALYRQEVEAVDFTVLRPSADEIALLRTTRKPVWVEVSAYDILLYETRFFEDMQNLKTLYTQQSKIMESLGPDTEKNEFSKFVTNWVVYQEKADQMKTHWAEDLPRIEAGMDPAGKEAVQPILQAVTLYVEAYPRMAELLGRIHLLDDHLSDVDRLEFVAEIQEDFLKAFAAEMDLFSEMKKAVSVKIRYLRRPL